MRRLLLLLLMVWTLCPTASYAQDRATLTLLVRDEADRPVPGLTLTLRDGNSKAQSATTDTSGQATFAGLRSSSITLSAATTAAGQPIKLDPTTPKDGLVLGLIPGATRVVPFRLVDGLLFLDPLEVFAGTDESAGAVASPLASAAPTPAVPAMAADQPDSTATLGALLWCLGVSLVCLIGLTALLIVTRRRR